jgi:hypothetical protein
MEHDMHNMYEVGHVGSQGGQNLYASNETERITNFNDGQDYTSLRGPQQDEPQQNMTTAVNNDEDLECHVLKDEL